MELFWVVAYGNTSPAYLTDYEISLSYSIYFLICKIWIQKSNSTRLWELNGILGVKYTGWHVAFNTCSTDVIYDDNDATGAADNGGDDDGIIWTFASLNTGINFYQ